MSVSLLRFFSRYPGIGGLEIPETNVLMYTALSAEGRHS
jgi:hypothetical protein